MASSDLGLSRTSLVHLVDSEALPGRIRRVELIRRGTDSPVVVVGPFEGECRCAGFGLQAHGSSLPRTLGTVLCGLDVGPGRALPCSWSYRVARSVSEFCREQLLIASGPPSPLAVRERLEGLYVIAPDECSANAWQRLGALDTRVLPACGFPDRAPTVPTAAPEALRVGIVCDEAQTEEEALLMLHRFGVVALTKKPFFACLSADSPHVGAMMRYARHVGIESSFELLDESGFPGEIDVAMVVVEDAARSSEQVLDLCARGIVVIAYSARAPIDDSISLREHGIIECPAGVTNAGSVHLLALHTEPDLLESARKAAFRLGVGLPPDGWKARFGELVGSLISGS
ncbi:MAG: hypothetical protein VX641_07680 [Planctomycetota bacterium]|nr:hypothetical protein [Planctomycetota bacterium]